MKRENDVTIMIVDDNKQMREVIKDSLSDIPCDVIECSSGREAVEGYGSSRPDWVLMDVMMSPMNGIAALTEIRKNHPDANVIMVSNSAEDGVIAASMKAGAKAFVNKEHLLMISTMISQPMKGK